MSLRLRVALALLLVALPSSLSLVAWSTAQRRRAVLEATRATIVARMEAGGRALCEDEPARWPRGGGVGARDDAGPFRGRGGDRAARNGPRARRLTGDAPRGRDGAPARLHDKARPFGARAGVERPSATDEARRGRTGRGARIDAGDRLLLRGAELFAYDDAFHPARRDAPVIDEPLRDALEVDDVALSRQDGGMRVAVRMPWATGPCAVIVIERRGPVPALESTVPWASLAVPFVTLALALVGALVALGGPIRRLLRIEEALSRTSLTADLPLDTRGRDEVAAVARALVHARREALAHVEALEARDRTLTAYVDGTTHDLAIPLTVLNAHLTTLALDAKAERPASSAVIAQATAETHYLAELVSNLATAARLEHHPPVEARHPVDLRDVVSRVIARHAPLARAKHVELDHALPEAAATVLGDDLLLERAIGNLVHNAIRHGARAHVAVVVTVDPSAKRVRVVVMDDGPGLSPEEAARLTREDQRAVRTRGGGLGLTIVRGIADAHGMRVEVTRAPREHAAVVLDAPLASGRGSTPPQPAPGT